MHHNISSYYIFPHYVKNGTIFGKKLLNTKCVFWSSLQLLSETFLILWITGRDMIRNVYWSSCKVPVVLVSFLYRFSKNTQKFYKNPSSDRRVFPCGRTVRHDEANVAFRNFANRFQITELFYGCQLILSRYKWISATYVCRNTRR